MMIEIESDVPVFIKYVIWCCGDTVTGACIAVIEQSECGEETATDYDSRSLMQFCKSHQLLLGAYEQLSRQNEVATTSIQSAPSPTDEHDIKTVNLLSTASSAQFNNIGSHSALLCSQNLVVAMIF